MSESTAADTLGSCQSEFVFVEDIARLPLVREELGGPGMFKNRLAFLLHNILSPDECAAVVRAAEGAGFKTATIRTGFKTIEYRPDHREGENCYLFDASIRELLFQRVKDYLPKDFRFGRLVGLNERMTVLRYGPGGFFGEHMDGTVIAPDDSAISFITIQLYLNEAFEGGETAFYPDGPARRAAGDSGGRRRVAVTPRTGSAAIFEHKILHEGSLVTSGTKLTLRADVFYTRYYPPAGDESAATEDANKASSAQDQTPAWPHAPTIWSKCAVQ